MEICLGQNSTNAKILADKLKSEKNISFEFQFWKIDNMFRRVDNMEDDNEIKRDIYCLNQ